MSLLDDARQAATTTDDTDADPAPEPDANRKRAGTTASFGSKFTTTIRGQEVTVDGDTLTLARPGTKQPADESSNFLTDTDTKGVPRGVESASYRNIVQTASMQTIVNGIVDQLLGGDLAFIDDEDAMSDADEAAVAQFKTILRDVLTGPHMGDEDLDDLVTAAVEDMLGPGNAYWQLLAPESGDLPVASITSLDPLTIRHNVDRHGYPRDPPYFQVHGMFTGTTSALGSFDPVPLESDQVAVMRYPKGNRSYRTYPVSAAWQIREWLEILADSVTHHKRYYSDNEVPPGLMQVVDATDSTIDDIQNQVEQASGDPRDFPIVGGEAPANWVEMGGTAINLNVIEEQRWFFVMCLGALGLNKAEVGLVEDVNYSNGEVQAEIIFKRVAGPFGKQFERAMMHVAEQFQVFHDLGKPFTPTLAYTDPKAERAKQERLRQEYEAGKLTLRQYVRRAGDQDLADDDDAFTVTIGGETIDYGSHPKWVAGRLLSAAGATDPSGDEPVGEGDEAE